MPELPEVELVARALDKLVTGRSIVQAELLRERLVPNLKPRAFVRSVSPARVNFVHRRGKHVLFDLDNGFTLLAHLRMSGRFLLLPPDRENPKFTHAIFHFADESRLVFQDQRHFGYMNAVKTSKLSETKEIRKLAPEPLSEEFNFDYLRNVLRANKRTIKEVLIDQSKVCGLGNIYAVEALFDAGVRPGTRSSGLSRPRTAALLESIRETLRSAVDAGSTLNVDPENIDGSYDGGSFESMWKVYDREGEPCFVCSMPIRRIRQGGRSSYFCPACQKR
jgi:formamidopyrimidine-DNA glycosylase